MVLLCPCLFTSTYAQEKPGTHLGYEYSRSHNPTRSALEASLANIESGAHALAFASGMAAIDAVIKLLKPGDEVVSTNDLYGGTYRIFDKMFAAYGITFHFVPMGSIEVVEKHINANTKLLWVETPTNPLCRSLTLRPWQHLLKHISFY